MKYVLVFPHPFYFFKKKFWLRFTDLTLGFAVCYWGDVHWYRNLLNFQSHLQLAKSISRSWWSQTHVPYLLVSCTNVGEAQGTQSVIWLPKEPQGKGNQQFLFLFGYFPKTSKSSWMFLLTMKTKKLSLPLHVNKLCITVTNIQDS